MGRAQRISIPGGGASVPVSVSGDTVFTVGQDFQVAYDPADFDSNAYWTLSGQTSYGVICFPENTILWVRNDPLIPDAADLFVLTQIKSRVV